jgi:hypothetical protein
LHPAANITWLHARAEEAPLPDRIDLVTAGTAIHWMQHDVLFPRLADRTPLLAILNVEMPPDPRWSRGYDALMTEWLARIDQVYDTAVFSRKNRTYESWLDIAGRQTFHTPFSQTVDGFVENMHSTATNSRARMGADLAAEFGRDLHAVLAPHTKDGLITFDTVTNLVWGTPRRYARAQPET